MNFDELIAERFTSKDHSKARKTLIAAAVLTLFFASIQIVKDEISFFGFVVKIEQISLVAFGQATTLLLLVVFSLRIFPEYLTLYRAYSIKRLELLEEKETIELNNAFGSPEGPDYDGSIESAFDQISDNYRSKKKLKLARFDRMELSYATTSSAVLDLILPVLLSAIAITEPTLPKSVSLNVFSPSSPTTLASEDE